MSADYGSEQPDDRDLPHNERGKKNPRGSACMRKKAGIN
jgi:hypothetical protein